MIMAGALLHFVVLALHDSIQAVCQMQLRRHVCTRLELEEVECRSFSAKSTITLGQLEATRFRFPLKPGLITRENQVRPLQIRTSALLGGQGNSRRAGPNS
jgi:hypothetical protein